MSDLAISHEDGALRLTLDAPERRNAVDTVMLHEMTSALRNAEVRVAVVRGHGGSFCAGARLSAAGPNPGFLPAAHDLIGTIISAPFPVIAVVDGAAAGFGCSLALAADLTIASDRSSFIQSFVRVGLMPDGGGADLLVASVGRARAAWLALNGERVSASAALAMGMIGACVPDAALDDEAEALISRVAHGPTRALGQTKAAIRRASLPDLAHDLELEGRAQQELLASDDYREGVAAFAAKRPPHFSGR